MIKITDKAKDYLTKTAVNQDKPYVRFLLKEAAVLDSNTNGTLQMNMFKTLLSLI